MAAQSLLELIRASNDLNSTLMKWTIDCIEYAATLDDESKIISTEDMETIKVKKNEITEYIKYSTSLESEENQNSHLVILKLSYLCTLLLKLLQDEEGGAIFDMAELLTKILNDEIVCSTEDDSDKKKKKKLSSSKSSTHSIAKDIASTILIQMNETFPKDLSTLAPIIMTTALKCLKKNIEKSKYRHATYMTTLMQLINRVVRFANERDVDPQIYAKISKFSKSIFESMATDNQEYPIEFIASLLDIWSYHYTSDTYIKEHKNDLLEHIHSKLCVSIMGIYAFSNDKTRIVFARTIADILFSLHFSKQLISLEDALDFYVQLFCESKSRDIKSGCFESLIHFISLNNNVNHSYLKGTNYLKIVKHLSTIFLDYNIKKKHLDSLSRYMRYFTYMHRIFLPRIGESSKCQMLLNIVAIKTDDSEGGTEEVIKSLSQSVENQWATMVQLNLLTLLLEDLSSTFATDKSLALKMKDALEELVVSNIFALRIFSTETFVTFLKQFPSFISDVIEKGLTALTKNFENTENFDFSVNHGLAYMIANLIKICDSDFVPYELIMRITVFATSYIKNHTTTTNGDVYFKGLICWILMTGLMNYPDEQYINMQKPQLQLFWKVLLTHTFSYNSEDELYKNLEIRNHAMACLISFLNNCKIDEDLANQVSYLLTKCSNFNHSVSTKSKNIDNALIQNEHRILQVYLCLRKFIKSDFNSSLLILILRNFSDVNLYTMKTTSILNSVKKIGGKKSDSKDDDKDPVVDYSVSSLLRQSDPFAYGLSSKIFDDQNGKESIEYPMSELKYTDIKHWFQPYEFEVKRAVSPTILFDSLSMLYKNLPPLDHDVVRVTTSLIDSSMELFATVFPYLNRKIQYSVIESLNLSMFSKMTVPMRSVAVSANVCTTLHDTLTHIHNSNLTLDNDVGQLLLESIRKIEFFNDSYIATKKANCVGLIIAAMCRGVNEEDAKALLNDQTAKIINQIAETDEPYLRTFEILSLANIYKYTLQASFFSTILDVIKTLIKDPHPVVHYWSLKALNIFLEKHYQLDTSETGTILELLDEILLTDKYGIFGSSIINANYFSEYNSHHLVGEITCTITEILGPNLSFLNEIESEIFKELSVFLLLSNDIVSQYMALKIYENISTFKVVGLLKDNLFIKIITDILDNNISIGIGSNVFNSALTINNEVFPSSASTTACLKVLEIVTQLIRLQKRSLLPEKLEVVTWRILNLFPSNKIVISYFEEYLLNTMSEIPNWLAKLVKIFNTSADRLFEDSNIAKRAQKLDKDSENYKSNKEYSEGFANEVNETSGKEVTNDHIHWRFRKVLTRMILQVCHEGFSSDSIQENIREQIPTLIKLAHQLSSISNEEMRLGGLNIIKLLLTRYAYIKDADTNDYVLGIQEAQITSAIMPSFNWGSSPEVIRLAIEVAGDLITSDVIPLGNLPRVSKLLVSGLSFFSDSTTNMKVMGIEVQTQKAKRKIELGILNAWADIVQTAYVNEDKELISFSKEYWPILVPLWIVSLREYIMIKYEEEKKQVTKETMSQSGSVNKKQLYDSVWLNFIQGISCVMEHDLSVVLKSLDENELEGFTYILVIQCFEEIVRNIDNSLVKLDVLRVLSCILKCPLPLDFIFEEDLNTEITDILSRLVTTGSLQEKTFLIEILDSLMKKYISINDTHELFLSGIDKMYELLRLIMLIIKDLLPFVQHTVSETTNSGKELNSMEVNLLRKTFKVLEQNIPSFDAIFKLDLYACLLFVIGRIFLSDSNEALVPVILPLLKSIITDLVKSNEQKMLDIFYFSLEEQLVNSITSESSMATYLLMITNGYNSIAESTLDTIADHLIVGLKDENSIDLTAHAIRSILKQSNSLPACSYLTRKLLPLMYNDVVKGSINSVSANIIISLVVYFATTISKDEKTSFSKSVSIAILFIIAHAKSFPNHKDIAIRELNRIVSLEPTIVKEIIASLNDDQKAALDTMAGLKTDIKQPANDHTVNLKSFAR